MKLIKQYFNKLRQYYEDYKYPIRIIVKWPSGLVEIGLSSRNWNSLIGTERQIIESHDADDHYTPLLRKNVGRQGVDWEYKLVYNHDSSNNNLFTGHFNLCIMFRKKHEKLATYYKLLWG